MNNSNNVNSIKENTKVNTHHKQLNKTELETKIRHIAEKENISFLKTLVKFKNQKEETIINTLPTNNNNNNNNVTDINKPSVNNEIPNEFHTTQTTTTITQSKPIAINSPTVSNDVYINLNKALERKIMEDNSMSSIQSLEQENQNPNEQCEQRLHNKNNNNNQHITHEHVVDTLKHNNKEGLRNSVSRSIGISNKKSVDNQSMNIKKENKHKFFNNKRNIEEIEKLIKETKIIEKELLFRPFSPEHKHLMSLSTLNPHLNNTKSNLHTTPLDIYFENKRKPNINYYSHLTTISSNSNKSHRISQSNSSNKKDKIKYKPQITKMKFKKKEKTGVNSYTEGARRINKSKQQSLQKESITASINLYDSSRKQQQQQQQQSHKDKLKHLNTISTSKQYHNNNKPKEMKLNNKRQNTVNTNNNTNYKLLYLTTYSPIQTKQSSYKINNQSNSNNDNKVITAKTS